MQKLKLRPISVAVVAALSVNTVFAETADDIAVLDTITVTDHQGLKVQSNVVTTKKKEESTQTDLRGLLKDEPAINIGGGNGTSQFLYIRGMGQNSIDVKVDNAYSDSQIHYHQGRHMLDPAMVKIVSVQKGAGSASAGIGQTNGAVIAKTLDAKELLENSDKNFGAKIGAGVSTNHSHSYNAAVYGKGEIFDALISANRVKESDYKAGKDYLDPTDQSNRVSTSALDKISYLAKLGATLGDHRFVLSHLGEQHEGIRSVREEFVNFNATNQAPRNRKMSVTNTNLEWNGKNLGFAQEATANVYRLVHGRWSADDSKNGYAGYSNNPEGEATKLSVETIGANLNFDSALHESILLKYGVNYRNQEIKPHAYFLSGLSNQEKRDVGLYAEAITTPFEKIILTTGIRYDHFDFKAMDGKKRSDGSFSPSVGIIYEPIEHLSLSASHNYATRSPRMYDAIQSNGGRSIVSIADDTKAEKARNTEIGFNYNNGIFSFDGSYFWQHIKNALTTTSGKNSHLCPQNDPRRQRCYEEIINDGVIKNKGYELNAGVQYNGFTARIGVAHSKPRLDGDRASINPEFASIIGRTWTGSLSYRFAQPNVEIGVHHRIVEKVKASDNYTAFNSDATPKVARNNMNGVQKDGYNVTDITINWKPLGTDKMNVNFSVDNIANKLYRSHAQRGASNSGRGREFRTNVNYTF